MISSSAIIRSLPQSAPQFQPYIIWWRIGAIADLRRDAKIKRPLRQVVATCLLGLFATGAGAAGQVPVTGVATIWQRRSEETMRQDFHFQGMVS
jgi:hypothetical protein